jgi:hypothetical protein
MQEFSDTLICFGVLFGGMYAGKALVYYKMGRSKFASVREMYKLDKSFFLPYPLDMLHKIRSETIK